MKDRTFRIMRLLDSNRSIKMSLLAEILGVSIVTLRRDLDILENRGIVHRTHGYVSLDGADKTGRRIAKNYHLKKSIVKAAVEVVEEGDNILLESGSCCAMLAEELALTKKNINIITNSIFIVRYVRKFKVKITLLGGYLQPESQMLIGPMTKKCVEQVYAQKLFIGTDGFVSEYGFTGRDHLHVDTVVQMADHAKDIFVLTESEKFQRRGSFDLIQFDKIKGVFTDNGIPEEAEEILVKNKVKVHKVSAINE